MMSTCPEKDIHSIYLDGELPDIYKSAYQEHLTKCSRCRSELGKMEALHAVFQNDSKSLDVDSNYLNQSFERLQTRMSYDKITRHKAFKFPTANITIAAAAAAVVLILLIPAKITIKTETTASLNPVKRISSIAPKKNSVIIHGTISDKSLASFFNSVSSKSEFPYPRNFLTHNTDFIDKNISSSLPIDESLTSIDIFKPEFSTNNSDVIRIAIPNPGDIPIELFMNAQGTDGYSR